VSLVERTISRPVKREAAICKFHRVDSCSNERARQMRRWRRPGIALNCESEIARGGSRAFRRVIIGTAARLPARVSPRE